MFPEKKIKGVQDDICTIFQLKESQLNLSHFMATDSLNCTTISCNTQLVSLTASTVIDPYIFFSPLDNRDLKGCTYILVFCQMETELFLPPFLNPPWITSYGFGTGNQSCLSLQEDGSDG